MISWVTVSCPNLLAATDDVAPDESNAGETWKLKRRWSSLPFSPYPEAAFCSPLYGNACNAAFIFVLKNFVKCWNYYYYWSQINPIDYTYTPPPPGGWGWGAIHAILSVVYTFITDMTASIKLGPKDKNKDTTGNGWWADHFSESYTKVSWSTILLKIAIIIKVLHGRLMSWTGKPCLFTIRLYKNYNLTMALHGTLVCDFEN